MGNKKKYIGSDKTQGDYLRITNTKEAKKVAEESKDLPHLKKPIKYLLKK